MDRIIIGLGSNNEEKLSGLREFSQTSYIQPTAFSSKNVTSFKVIDFEAPPPSSTSNNMDLHDQNGDNAPTFPFKIEPLRIVDAHCGFDTTVYVTSCNKLLLCGFPKSGHPGRLHFLVDSKVVPSLSLSTHFSYPISHISQLYNQFPSERPRIDFLSPETKITAGNAHIVILSLGKLYYISENFEEECGVKQDYLHFIDQKTSILQHVHPNIQPIISYPLLKYWEQLQLFEPIYHVRAGFRYTVIVGTHPVTKKSCVLATGSNLYNCINGTYWNDSNPNIQVPGRVFHIAALDGESIAKISSGYGDLQFALHCVISKFAKRIA